MGMEREISNTRVVSDVEKRLPPAARREWSRSLHDEKSNIDRSDRFPALLQFLLREKKSVEYDMSEIRSSSHSSPRASVNTTRVKEKDEPSKRSNSKRCLIHEAEQHNTSECRAYPEKSLQEKAQLVKEKGRCFCCLTRGHRVIECKRKRQCDVHNCTRLHHPSLHDDSIPTSDVRLLDFTDSCVDAAAQMNDLPGLNVLNYPYNLHPLLEKLPSHIHNKWPRICHHLQDDTRSLPTVPSACKVPQRNSKNEQRSRPLPTKQRHVQIS